MTARISTVLVVTMMLAALLGATGWSSAGRVDDLGIVDFQYQELGTSSRMVISANLPFIYRIVENRKGVLSIETDRADTSKIATSYAIGSKAVKSVNFSTDLVEENRQVTLITIQYDPGYHYTHVIRGRKLFLEFALPGVQTTLSDGSAKSAEPVLTPVADTKKESIRPLANGKPASEAVKKTEPAVQKEKPAEVARGAQTAIYDFKSISVESTGGATTVTLDFSAAITKSQYKVILVGSPARYVLDFHGARNRLAKKEIDDSTPFFTRIRTAQNAIEPEPITRVVFDQPAQVQPTVDISGTRVILTFGKATAAKSDVGQPKAEKKPEPVKQAAIKADAAVKPVEKNEARKPAEKKPETAKIADKKVDAQKPAASDNTGEVKQKSAVQPVQPDTAKKTDTTAKPAMKPAMANTPAAVKPETKPQTQKSDIEKKPKIETKSAPAAVKPEAKKDEAIQKASTPVQKETTQPAKKEVVKPEADKKTIPLEVKPVKVEPSTAPAETNPTESKPVAAEVTATKKSAEPAVKPTPTENKEKQPVTKAEVAPVKLEKPTPKQAAAEKTVTTPAMKPADKPAVEPEARKQVPESKPAVPAAQKKTEAVKPAVDPFAEQFPDDIKPGSKQYNQKVNDAFAMPPDQEQKTVAPKTDLKLDSAQQQRQPALTAGDSDFFQTREISGESKKYSGKKVSLVFESIPLSSLILLLGQMTNKNFIVDPSVRNVDVSISLQNIPWDQALDVILDYHGLGKVEDDNLIRIASQEKLASEASDRRTLADQRALAVPLRQVTKPINYAKAADLAQLLSRNLSSKGEVVVDARTNTLVISDIPSKVDEQLNLIEALDIPTKQVIVEARIVETTRDFINEFGLQYGFSSYQDTAGLNSPGWVFPNTAGEGGGFNTPWVGTTPLAVNLPSPSANTSLLGSFANIAGSFRLDVLLSAAESEKKVRVLSRPRISAQNNSRAEIKSGVEVPYQVVQNNTVSIRFREATLRLEVTPHITADSTVIMDVVVDKSSLGIQTSAGYTVQTRQATSTIRVKDGGVAVIGGVLEISDSHTEERVPLLSKIPFLGALFRNDLNRTQNTELLIFIAPKIIG